MTEPARITVEEVKKRIDSGEPVLFIDTRNPEAWGNSDVKIPGALRIHYTRLQHHLNELPLLPTFVTYCT